MQYWHTYTYIYDFPNSKSMIFHPAGSFCWFLNNQEILDHIEKNHQLFSSVMLNVYRATDLMFPEEYELEEARLFSRQLLEKVVAKGTGDDDDHFTKSSSNLQRMVFISFHPD